MKKGLDSIASLKSRRDLLVSGCIRDFSHSESAMFIHDSVYQIVMDYHCRIRSMEESISIYLCGSISSRLSICKHEDEENESANSDTKVIVDRGLCSDALRQGVWRVEDPDGGGSVLRFVKYSDGHEIGNPLYLSSGGAHRDEYSQYAVMTDNLMSADRLRIVRAHDDDCFLRDVYIQSIRDQRYLALAMKNALPSDIKDMRRRFVHYRIDDGKHYTKWGIKCEVIPLTLQMLGRYKPAERTRLLGERLFPKIQVVEPRLAGKITGMLLEMDHKELLGLLNDHRSLINKINEALYALMVHQQKSLR